LLLGVLADRAYRSLLRGRPKRTERPIDASAKEIVAIYRELEREMVRLGVPRDASTTPMEHARSLEARRAIGADVVVVVTSRYVDARFGGERLPASELASLRASVRALHELDRPSH